MIRLRMSGTAARRVRHRVALVMRDGDKRDAWLFDDLCRRSAQIKARTLHLRKIKLISAHYNRRKRIESSRISTRIQS